MTDIPPTTSATNEARLELAVAAAATERANKPRWIVVLGAFALSLAIIFMLVALQSRRTALGKVAVERAYTHKILDLKQRLEGEAAKLAARGTAPNNRIGADLEALAHAMEIQTGTIADSPDVVTSGMQRHTYTATAVNQDPERILRWLVETQKNPTFAGLEIMQLSLRPGAATTENTAGWNVNVKFGRWEKK